MVLIIFIANWVNIFIIFIIFIVFFSFKIRYKLDWSWGHIFTCVQPFYERVVSNLDP